MAKITLTIDGEKYVAIPEAEFRRLRAVARASAQEDAVAWARSNLGDTLRKARESAGLTQMQLAKKLKKSQVMVSRSESGDVSVGEAYVTAVLKACGLPKDWIG